MSRSRQPVLSRGTIVSAIAAACSLVAGCLDTVDEDLWKGRDGKPDVGDAWIVDAVSCGTIGAPCCIGSTCNEGSCVSGVCQQCGGLGEACCAGRLCAEGLCTGAGDGVCTACGGAGEACCTGNSCDANGCCVAGVCVAVGSTCPGIGGVCTSGSCGTCGGAGEACCTGDVCTGSNLSCVGGKCVSCGGAGEQCCAGDTCKTTTLICAAGTCAACGGAGQPCCAGGICSVSGYACSTTSTCEKVVVPDLGVDVAVPKDTAPPVDVSTPDVIVSPVDMSQPTCGAWASWTCWTTPKVCEANCPNTTSPAYILTCNQNGCSCENAALQAKTCTTPPSTLACTDCEAAFKSGCCLGL